MFKVNTRNTRKRYEICSKLAIKAPERRQWQHSSVFIVNNQHISNLFMVFLLLILNKSILAEKNRITQTCNHAHHWNMWISSRTFFWKLFENFRRIILQGMCQKNYTSVVYKILQKLINPQRFPDIYGRCYQVFVVDF